MAILIPILILIFAIVDSSSAQVAQLRLLLGLLGLFLALQALLEKEG